MTSFEASYLYLISDDLPPPRIRLMKLAAIRGELEPLMVNCIHQTWMDPPASNKIPLLMICSNLPYMRYDPMTDLKTYKEIVQDDKALFSLPQRDISYSVEVCSNRVADAVEDIVPPNVNPFAAYEATRRQQMISRRQQMVPNHQQIVSSLLHVNDCQPGIDMYHDIPSEYLQPAPSVGSSSLTIYEYNILDSGPGFVHNPQVSQNFVLPPFESIPRQYRYAPQDYFIPPSYPPPRPFLPPRTVSYLPPLQTISDAVDALLPQMNFHDVPLLANTPLVMIIPVVPIFVQTLVLAPPQPEYMTTPLAFNCVLRTPFPQFIYSVEPCNRPNCPFTYRYRCPAPQLESHMRAPRQSDTPCRFRRGKRFNYRCSNRQDQQIYTPKRSCNSTPVRRLSQQFVTPEQTETEHAYKKKHYSKNRYKDQKYKLDTVQEIETVTRRLENFSLNGSTVRRVSSEVRVQYASRIISNSRNNYARFDQQTPANEMMSPRDRQRYKDQQRYRDRPLFQTHKVSLDGKNFNLFNLTGIDYLIQKRPIGGMLSLDKFNTESKSISDSIYKPYFLTMNPNGPLPNVLQEVSVPVINNSVCESMYQAAGYIEHIPNIFICAGWRKGGFDSCEGDSGGPMVIQRPDKRWLLAGIISWGIGCAEPNQPGVYTRISAFRDWINQILQF